ncbi:MAG: hypothetical protein FD166_3609 [Bacteroidetes bacterium]|nr:MAG: hypothetical protein FD166_3609 [Bacteroidota bacterium]
MLIDQSYFVGEILVPNLTGVGPIPAGNVEELTRFITKYEPDYLDEVLGPGLSEAFQAGISAATPDQRWIDLKSKLVNDTRKESPIAGYVYYHFYRDRLSTSSGLGEIESSAENASVVLNTDKMARAYNDAVRKGRAVFKWVLENASTYTELDPSHLYKLSPVNIFGI